MQTEAAEHHLDLDCHTWVRRPRREPLPVAGGSPVIIRRFFSDNRTVRLVKVVACEVGQPMELLIQLGRDGEPRKVHTTVVVGLERLRDETAPSG